MPTVDIGQEVQIYRPSDSTYSFSHVKEIHDDYIVTQTTPSPSTGNMYRIKAYWFDGEWCQLSQERI